MKHNSLSVKLRPVGERAYLPEYLDPRIPTSIANPGSSATRIVSAALYQSLEISLALDETFKPFAAEALAITFETKSRLNLGQEDLEQQTCVLPLQASNTARKKNHLGPTAFAEYIITSRTFWTRDALFSETGFESLVLPLMMPKPGGYIAVRVTRGKLTEMEPRLPIREYDTNPARAPTDIDIGGPFIVDERWFKATRGASGAPLEFRFEVRDGSEVQNMKEASEKELACVGIGYEKSADEDVDDDEPVFIKSESIGDTIVAQSQQAKMSPMTDTRAPRLVDYGTGSLASLASTVYESRPSTIDNVDLVHVAQHQSMHDNIRPDPDNPSLLTKVIQSFDQSDAQVTKRGSKRYNSSSDDEEPSGLGEQPKKAAMKRREEDEQKGAVDATASKDRSSLAASVNTVAGKDARDLQRKKLMLRLEEIQIKRQLLDLT